MPSLHVKKTEIAKMVQGSPLGVENQPPYIHTVRWWRDRDQADHTPSNPHPLAAPERAILEMLSHVDSQAGFIHAWQNMESLPALRPLLMQELLEQCNSIKVVRLCLYMADKHQLQWFRRLDRKKFDLGSGKRSIVTPGKLNEKYQITVPKQLEEDSWM